MAVIETWIPCELTKAVQIQYLDGSLFSHNGDANLIGAVLTKDGEPVDVTGTVTGYAVISNGSTVPCIGTKSGNKASVIVPPAAYYPGQIFITVFVTDGSTVTTVAAVSSTVMRARTDSQVNPGSVVTDWTTTINAAMQAVETAAENLGDMIAVPYEDITFPVPLGTLTIHSDKLYRCISPIESSEAWTAAHWEEKTVAEILGEKADKTDTVLETTLSRGRKGNTTVGTASFAFGKDVEASGNYSHAEGHGSQATGIASHAEGKTTHSIGEYSHAEGENTFASHLDQHVFGRNNVIDSSTAQADEYGTYVEIVGNGLSTTAKSNARTLDWSGNENLAGDLKIYAGTANEQSVSGKADKVSGSTSGDIATLDGNGNLTDSGKKFLGTDLPMSTSDSTKVADNITSLKSAKADIIEVSDTTPASVKTLADGADGQAMSVTVGIEPVQSGSGDPSPENVRPISGWTEVRISRTGKNLIPNGTNTSNGYQNNRYLNADGTVNASSTSYFISEYFPVKQNANYVWGIGANKSTTGKDGPSICFYDANKNYISGLKMNKVVSHPGTVPSNAVYARSSQVKDLATDPLIFEYGTEASVYEVYNSSSREYAIEIPSTPGEVYGGTLTVNNDGTGKLIVTHIYFDASQLTWDLQDEYETYNNFRCTRSNNSLVNNSIMSNVFHYSGVNPYNSNVTSNKYIWISVPAEINTSSALSNFFSENPTQFVCERYTPVSYDLTSEQVNALMTTLKGTNILWADTGDVLSVDYSADTKLYVDQQNAEDQTDITAIRTMIADSDATTATESHAIGDVFICNNKLLRATDAIASGESIVIGSNVEVINLADYIKEQVTSIAGLQTNVTALKSYGVDPDAVLTKRAFIQNGTHTYSNRTITITNGVINFAKGSSGSTNYRGIFFTKEFTDTDVSLTNVVPPVESLEPISKIAGANALRVEKIQNSGTGLPFMRIYYCSIDSDIVTVESYQAVSNDTTQTHTLLLDIPGNATHYALFLYQGNNSTPFDIDYYLKFLCIPSEE